MALAELSGRLDLARLTIAGEVLATWRVPILKFGGYQVSHVTPVDQFLFSEHIEGVAVMER